MEAVAPFVSCTSVPGNIQKPVRKVVDEVVVELSVEESIALAMELCPPGEWIELHAEYCDVCDCTCMPRRIMKTVISS